MFHPKNVIEIAHLNMHRIICHMTAPSNADKHV